MEILQMSSFLQTLIVDKVHAFLEIANVSLKEGPVGFA